MSTVDNTLNRNFRADAEKRGYLVFGLAAPAGELFFESGDRIFPEFLKMVLASTSPQHNFKWRTLYGDAAMMTRHLRNSFYLPGFPRLSWRPAAPLGPKCRCVFMPCA